MTPIDAVEHKYVKRTTISWHVSNTCNYACSYCPESLHSGTEPWPDFDCAKEFVRQVGEHFNVRLGRQLVFLFTGGEPTLYPRLVELIAYINESIPSRRIISIISNGSRTLRYWQEFEPHIQGAVLSYHIENDYLEKFIEVATYLHSRRKLVRVNLPMHLGRFEDGKIAFEAMRQAGLPVFLKPLWEWGKSNDLYPYSAAQLEFLRSTPSAALPVRVKRGGQWEESTVESLIVNDDVKYKGWRCGAGIQHLAVREGDRIYAGECKASYMGKISEVFTQPPRFPTDFLTCPVARCVCVADLTLSKNRPAARAAEPQGGGVGKVAHAH